MEIHKLPDRELKRIILKVFRELQEKRIKAYHYVKSSIHKGRQQKGMKRTKDLRDRQKKD